MPVENSLLNYLGTCYTDAAGLLRDGFWIGGRRLVVYGPSLIVVVDSAFSKTENPGLLLKCLKVLRPPLAQSCLRQGILIRHGTLEGRTPRVP